MRRHIDAIFEAELVLGEAVGKGADVVTVWEQVYNAISAARDAADKEAQEFLYAKEALARWDANEPSPHRANMDIVRAYFNRKGE